jgi:hypothetical protein
VQANFAPFHLQTFSARIDKGHLFSLRLRLSITEECHVSSCIYERASFTPRVESNYPRDRLTHLTSIRLTFGSAHNKRTEFQGPGSNRNLRRGHKPLKKSS